MKEIHTRNIEDQRSRVLLDSSPDAIVILDVDSAKFIDFNENALRLFKLSREVLLTIGPWDITPEHPNQKYSKEKAQENINSALLGGNPVFEWKHKDSEGNIIPCEIRLIHLPPYDRRIVMGSIVDLRKQQKFESEHRENLERLRLILDSNGLACFDWSSKDRLSHWDKNIFKVLGLDETKIKPGINSFLNIVHHEDVPRIRLKLASFIESKKETEDFEEEFRILKNDVIRCIKTYGSIFRNEEDLTVRVLGTLHDCTEKKLAQAQLEYQAKLLDNVSDAVYSTDLKFRITSWNRAARKMYGWTEEEAIGMAFNELITVTYLNKSREDIFSELMNNGAWKGTVIHESKTGTKFYIQSSINLLYDTDGNPHGSIGINRNINEQRKTEQKLLESEERLKMAIEATRLGIWDWFPQKDRIIWNDRMYEIFGRPTNQEMNLKDFFMSIIDPDDVQNITEKFHSVFEPGNTDRNANDEYRIIVDGKIKHIYSHGYILRDDQNTVQRITGTIQDVSRKKVQREKLSHQEQILSNVSDVVISTDKEFRISSWNKAAENLYGYAESEVIGKVFHELVDLRHVDRNMEDVIKEFKDKGTIKYVQIHNNRKGEDFHVLSHVTGLKDENGNSIGVIGVGQDISEKIETEEKLREITSKFQDATNAANVGIWEWNIDNDSVNWNNIVSRIYNVPEILNNCSFEELMAVVHYEDVKYLRECIDETQKNGVDLNCEFRILKPDKSIRYIKAMANISEKNECRILSGVTWDITQEKETERQKLKAKQLETKNKELEQFAYIASHDLQEPLHTMRAFTELLLEGEMIGENENAKKYLGYINDSARRMSKLVKGLLDYSRIGRQKELSEVDCKLLVDHVVNDLHALIERSNAHVLVNKLPVIKAIHTEIQLLFQNLLSNAIKFHKSGEIPHVEVSCRKKDNYWQFSVKDNGIGIEKEYREKIFIIFQRLNTRIEYDGTGIGLAHCQKIVESLGGQLWVRSLVGRGSTFYFTVPV